MAFGCGLELLGGLQSLPRVVADRLEQAIASDIRRAARHEERLVDQAEEQVQDLETAQAIVWNHRFGRLAVEIPCKDCQPPKNQPLVLLQQVIGPIDGIAQGLVPRGRRASAAD